MGDLKKFGRVGFKTLLYFEIVSTLALIIGLLVVNCFKPGAGFNLDPATLDPNLAKSYLEKAAPCTVWISCSTSSPKLF
jgi:aerobic C4-dicarboxylate transport protein